MLSAELLVMERLACGIVTPATHLYSPPWLVRRGENPTDTPTDVSRGNGTETLTSVPFPTLAPSGPTHSMEGVSLRACSKVTVQVRVRVFPLAMEDPVLATPTTGSSGTAGGRGRVGC